MLVQQHAASRVGGKEGGAEETIELEEAGGQRHGGDREQHHEGHREDRPHEDGYAVDRHPRGAHLEGGDDEVDGAHGRRDADEDDSQPPEVLIHAR